MLMIQAINPISMLLVVLLMPECVLQMLVSQARVIILRHLAPAMRLCRYLRAVLLPSPRP